MMTTPMEQLIAERAKLTHRYRIMHLWTVDNDSTRGITGTWHPVDATGEEEYGTLVEAEAAMDDAMDAVPESDLFRIDRKEPGDLNWHEVARYERRDGA